MEKLVRDIIPGIVVSDPDDPGTRFRIAPEEEREDFLFQKLLEEAREFDAGRSIDELADMLEVVSAIMVRRGWATADVTAERERKRKEAGGFSRFFVMDPVVQ